MEKEFGTFRKAAFGGFNRKDVIEYIEKMKNETYEYKMEVEQTVASLNEKILELEKASELVQVKLPEKAEETVAATVAVEGVGDIKDATKHLKSVADELCRSLGDFIEKLTKKGLYDGQTEAYEAPSGDVKQTDKVESILSVLSYLGSEDNTDGKATAEKKVKKDNVSSILDGFSFLS